MTVQRPEAFTIRYPAVINSSTRRSALNASRASRGLLWGLGLHRLWVGSGYKKLVA